MKVFIIALVLAWLASAGTAAFIASEKGRDGLSWFFSGVFFGIFALIAVSASPAVWEKPKSMANQKPAEGNTTADTGGQQEASSGQAEKADAAGETSTAPQTLLFFGFIVFFFIALFAINAIM